MEDEQSRLPLNSIGEEGPIYADQQMASLNEEEFNVQEYHHNASSIDDKGSLENQEWSTGVSEKCNLIVNYLPHEIDDLTLKVQLLLLQLERNNICNQ